MFAALHCNCVSFHRFARDRLTFDLYRDRSQWNDDSLRFFLLVRRLSWIRNQNKRKNHFRVEQKVVHANDSNDTQRVWIKIRVGNYCTSPERKTTMLPNIRFTRLSFLSLCSNAGRCVLFFSPSPVDLINWICLFRLSRLLFVKRNRKCIHKFIKLSLQYSKRSNRKVGIQCIVVCVAQKTRRNALVEHLGWRFSVFRRIDCIRAVVMEQYRRTVNPTTTTATTLYSQTQTHNFQS